MKVFVAGASGAIGRPLVAALFAARHEVIGMASRDEGPKALRERGAEGVVLNALDAAAVRDQLARILPDVIIDELTSLPKRYTPEEMRRAAPRDRQLRLEGGGNLHRAELQMGVKRYIVQSTGFFYGRGEGPASEEDPLAFDATPGVAGSVATYSKLEARVFGSPGMEGVALRYGFFYGPGDISRSADWERFRTGARATIRRNRSRHRGVLLYPCRRCCGRDGRGFGSTPRRVQHRGRRSRCIGYLVAGIRDIYWRASAASHQ